MDERVKWFQQLADPKPELENIVYSDSRLQKKIFRFFGPFCARSASKFAKSANMTQKIIFSNYFDMVSKNAEFDADFESVEKVLKKFQWKKVICMKV